MAKEVGHKYVRQDLRAQLEERNKQNAFLREQLVARVERAAHLETRLLYTLDTLDELQASSSRELQRAQRENTNLLEKINVLQTIAREADREKSDMSNAVLQLVEKVESCNDYSKWRASRVEFSLDIALHPVRPARTPRDSSSGETPEECTCIQAYSPAVVEELSESLAREKRAHALTTEEAERRIATLQSRIAVRDAEIARRVATCRCLPTSSPIGEHTQLELMSEDEQTRTVGQTAERNRILRSEVALLGDKVERERRLHLLVNHGVQTEPLTQILTSNYPLPETLHIDANALDDDLDPIPAALDTLDSQILQLRKRLTDLVMEKGALQDALRNELKVEDPRSSSSPRKRRRLERLRPFGDPTGGIAGRSDAAPLDKEPGDGFGDILLLEEECIRLMHSEDSLHSSLERLRQRNALLSEENTRLKEELSRLRNADDREADELSPLSLRPVDTSVIDLSFPPLQPDSISPVYSNTRKGGDDGVPGPSGWTDRTSSSSSASSSSSPITPTSTIEPCEVPLPRTPTSDDTETELSMHEGEGDEPYREAEEPQSPAHVSRSPSPQRSQATASVPPPPPPPDLDPGGAEQRDAHAIERELADVRADTEMREREMAEVRGLMEDLALRINNELQGS